MKSKKKQIRIICTIGPASLRKDTLIKMAEAGMSIARLNFSHGDHTTHQQVIDTIREINAESDYAIKILQDLAGYRIRVGALERPFELIKHQTIRMSNSNPPLKGAIPLDFDDDLGAIKEGMEMFIDDGHIQLQIVKSTPEDVVLEVIQGGTLKSRKGVNIPKLKLKSNILTEKDQKDIEWGIRNRVDYMAQSFVRNKRDILRVINLVKPRLPNCQIIAKIENREGVKNLNGIMMACEVILIARGDLGVSVPIYQIPVIQKEIIDRCNKKKKPVITATQMLESMTENPRPTRAEVSDVANAIFDGTDFVMLSGETAVGMFPVKTVRMMRDIVRYTQRAIARRN